MDDHFSENFEELFYSKTNEKPIVRKLLQDVFSKHHFEHALDVGSGPGIITEILNENSDKLTLIEINYDYEKDLKKKFPQAEVIINDIRNVDLSPGFDCIMLNQCFYFFPENEWSELLSKMKGFLDSNGLIVVILNDHDKLALETIFTPYIEELKPHFSWYYKPLNQLEALLKQLGEVEKIPYTYQVTYSSLEECTKAICDVVYGINNQEIKNKYWNKFEQLAMKFKQEDSTYKLDISAALFVLRV